MTYYCMDCDDSRGSWETPEGARGGRRWERDEKTGAMRAEKVGGSCPVEATWDNH